MRLDYDLLLALFCIALLLRTAWLTQELDKTDPSHRLVAHNKRSSSPNKFTTKLSTYRCLFCVLAVCKSKMLIPNGRGFSVVPATIEYNENVLDDIEQEDNAFNDLYPSMASSSILPKDTATEGRDDSTTDRDTIANSDDGRPHRLRANINGRNGPGSSMLASGSPENPTPASRKQLLTAQGVRCPAVSDKTWKEVQQLCNIECGPNLVQRIENGARGIGKLCEQVRYPEPMQCLIFALQLLSCLARSRSQVASSPPSCYLRSLSCVQQAQKAVLA